MEIWANACIQNTILDDPCEGCFNASAAFEKIGYWVNLTGLDKFVSCLQFPHMNLKLLADSGEIKFRKCRISSITCDSVFKIKPGSEHPFFLRRYQKGKRHLFHWILFSIVLCTLALFY